MFKGPIMPSPRRTWSQKEKNLSPKYVDNNDFDNNIDNEEKGMKDTNNSMKNATINDDMKTVTLHFDQPRKAFHLCHVWPP